MTSFTQGLTLVHFSAQRKYLSWDELDGVTVVTTDKTAQVELKGGRVKGPALAWRADIPVCGSPARRCASPCSQGLTLVHLLSST